MCPCRARESGSGSPRCLQRHERTERARKNVLAHYAKYSRQMDDAFLCPCRIESNPAVRPSSVQTPHSMQRCKRRCKFGFVAPPLPKNLCFANLFGSPVSRHERRVMLWENGRAHPAKYSAQVHQIRTIRTFRVVLFFVVRICSCFARHILSIRTCERRGTVSLRVFGVSVVYTADDFGGGELLTGDGYDEFLKLFLGKSSFVAGAFPFALSLRKPFKLTWQ